MSWATSPLEMINIAQLYLANPYLWDAIIYLLIFLGLTNKVFRSKNVYGGKHGKPIAIGVGLALTIAMVVWEFQRGWYIGAAQMAVLPLAILSIMFLYLLYNLLTDLLGFSPVCAASTSFLLVYAGVESTFGYPLESAMYRFETLALLLSLALLGSFIALIVCVSRLVWNGAGGWRSTGGNGGGNNGGNAGGNTGGNAGAAQPQAPAAVTPPPPTNAAAMNTINTLAGLLQRYRQELNQWQHQGDAVLVLNRNIRSGHAPANTLPAPMTVFVDQGNNMAGTVARIQQEFNNLAQNGGVHQVPQGAAAMAQITGQFAHLTAQHSNYWTNWQAWFQAGLQPGGIP